MARVTHLRGTFAENHGTLYIQGGTSDGGKTCSGQFFALDLTQPSWSASSPPWKPLSVGTSTQGAPDAHDHSMTLSNDKQNLIIYDSLWDRGIFTYSLTSGAWLTKRSLPSTPITTSIPGLHAITDPNTGIIYIPTGTNDNQTMVYYPDSGAGSSLPTPPLSVMSPDVSNYGAVWSTVRNSMLLYGGWSYAPPYEGNSYLVEFQPTSNTWSRIATTGTSPGDVGMHCMVSVYNGTKIVMFGGYSRSGLSLGSIYILDIKALFWTKGPNVDPSQNRGEMACTVAGDNFVAWGGRTLTRNSTPFGTMIIYNLRTNQWTDQFSLAPPSSTTASPTKTSWPTGSGTPTPVPDDSNEAAIGGGVAGAVVVAAIAFFLFRRHRSVRENQKRSTPQSNYGINPPDTSQHAARFINNPHGSITAASIPAISVMAASPSVLMSAFDGREKAPPQSPSTVYGPAYSDLSNKNDNCYSVQSTSGSPQMPYDTSSAYAVQARMPSSDIGCPSSSVQIRRDPQEYWPLQPAPEHRQSLPRYYPPLPFLHQQQQYQQYQSQSHQPPAPLQQQQQQQQQQQHLQQGQGLTNTDDQALQQQIALIKAQHDQKLERIRQEQEAELQIAVMKAQHEQKLDQIRSEQEAELQMLQGRLNLQS
ncbi:hypothetical protein BKA57DRAFT_497601 [Linnemannia elongata]|nr:hypothetical protein BKA57DRAFT_497601 [Linnemannia elongata]